ncbi:unnamed protein product [Didymodactylos carnosus]|uniref:Uncharacterized protein n=1 Tax=Didymodactylos carnosus TaxID=1234261 RepID=A0A815JUU2_9BILA|nr:unnamed protein product [Didymodactylos carnosus]CAF1383859.1 unnamed protein product [Didymodactylos carnosus]CAF3863608.1 unnamed protein product [Didymodactylos carnosus]CAF4278955.1 unnamed protein product [Didymodactylos carnosus]
MICGCVLLIALLSLAVYYFRHRLREQRPRAYSKASFDPLPDISKFRDTLPFTCQDPLANSSTNNIFDKQIPSQGNAILA